MNDDIPARHTADCIDPTIAADTLFVHSTDYSHIRLMNDSRWPWLIVLPRHSDCQELHHLDESLRTGFLADINLLSEIMQRYTQCQSVNIAMLGNVVAALHCHIVARDKDDPNWPRPIWGFEYAVPYDDNLPDGLINEIQRQLADNASR
ncbi:MAG: HIT domain-containing protein [Granulosicoccus sp.]